MVGIIVVGIFGLVVGSFLNVCIFRLPREGMSIVKPRSHCPLCLSPIHWYDNIPVISFIILGGKCRVCRKPISLRYPLVEILTGVIFSLAAFVTFYKVGDVNFESISHFIVMIYVTSMMIVVTFIDLEFRIIPDEISIPGIILSIVISSIVPSIHRWVPPIDFMKNLPAVSGGAAAVIGVLVGGGIIYVIGVVGKMVFKKEAMGFGDVKYMSMLGGFLGARGIILTLLVACFFGSVVGALRLIITKDRYIAFGPFLSLGAFLMLFFGEKIYKLVEIYQRGG